MWSYIIDGILIAIIVISAIVGIAKGFFDSLLSLIGTGVALVVSVLVAKHVSNWINKIFGLENFILEKLDGANEGSISFFGDKFTLTNSEVAKFCVWILTVVIVFLIIKLAIYILAKIFESVTKNSPTLSGLNRLFGMVFGIAKGGVVVVALLALCSMLVQVPIIGTTISDKIGETKITNWAYKYVDDFVETQLTEEKIDEIVAKIVSENSDDTTDGETNNDTTNSNEAETA